jgi:hypothetical protein
MQKVYAVHKLNSGYYCDHTTGVGEANEVEFEMQIIPSAYRLAAQLSLLSVIRRATISNPIREIQILNQANEEL